MVLITTGLEKQKEQGENNGRNNNRGARNQNNSNNNNNKKRGKRYRPRKLLTINKTTLYYYKIIDLHVQFDFRQLVRQTKKIY